MELRHASGGVSNVSDKTTADYVVAQQIRSG
jgi:hypothetical protein